MNESLAALLEDLNDKDIYIAKAAQEALAAMGDSVIPVLLNLLESKETRQLAGVVKVLGQIGGDIILESIMPLSDHPDRMVRMNLASAAAEIGGEKSVGFLLQWMGKSQDNFDRYWIVNMLSKFNSTEVVDRLIAILKETESNMIRYMAIRVLGELGAVKAIEDIRPFLKDEDRHVQEDAKIALEKLTDLVGENNNEQT